MSVIDTDTKLISPVEAKAAIAEGRTPKPSPGRHRPERVGTRRITPEQRVAALTQETAETPVVASRLVLVPTAPTDQNMRKLARLLGTLRKPRWLP